jgi:hypothetical protein
MAISKFGLACIAAVIAGGATSVLANGNPVPPPARSATIPPGTPIAAIANPQAAFKDIAVQFVSGKTFGHVAAIAMTEDGRAARLRIVVDDVPSQSLWLGPDDLSYSRSRDVIVARDVHAPAIAVADAR